MLGEIFCINRKFWNSEPSDHTRVRRLFIIILFYLLFFTSGFQHLFFADLYPGHLGPSQHGSISRPSPHQSGTDCCGHQHDLGLELWQRHEPRTWPLTPGVYSARRVGLEAFQVWTLLFYYNLSGVNTVVLTWLLHENTAVIKKSFKVRMLLSLRSFQVWTLLSWHSFQVWTLLS